MKPTLFAFLSLFSLAAVLSACSQEQSETTGMGETDTETTQSEQIEPQMRDEPGQTGQTEQETTFGGQETEEEVDLPEESPAAGGQQSPDAETDTGFGSGAETESEAEEMDTEQQSPQSPQQSPDVQ